VNYLFSNFHFVLAKKFVFYLQYCKKLKMCKLLENIIPSVCFGILFCNVANLTVERTVGNHTAGFTNVLTQDILQ